jgi:hypothetical protein
MLNVKEYIEFAKFGVCIKKISTVIYSTPSEGIKSVPAFPNYHV